MCSITSLANTYHIYGEVINDTGAYMINATVSLLYTTDSTLAYFAVTNAQGVFNIKNVKHGNYILQVATQGYDVWYNEITVNDSSLNIYSIVLSVPVVDAYVLDEVVFKNEKVPIKLLGDTIEYNAGSFRVQPDAVVEDLLKKLPGVDVDNEGNITSMGKKVEKVYVDGKEFFGNDPKIATKNLPADAVDKIQSYKKASDLNIFQGIKSGEQTQALNIVLKEERKSSYFGNVALGGGVVNKYLGDSKLFRFRKHSQLAFIGMGNNLNKYGFSLSDYLNMSGGIANVMQNGGKLTLEQDDVIDVGLPIDGEVSSGNCGINYVYEPNEKNKYKINWVGGIASRDILDTIRSVNFLNNQQFKRYSYDVSDRFNTLNILNLGWRRQEQNSHLLDFDMNVKMLYNNTHSNGVTISMIQQDIINELFNNNKQKAYKANISSNLSYIKKVNAGIISNLKNIISLKYLNELDKRSFINNIYYPSLTFYENAHLSQDIKNQKLEFAYNLSALIPIIKEIHIEPKVNVMLTNDIYSRVQIDKVNNLAIDSVNPGMDRIMNNYQLGVNFFGNHRKYTFDFGIYPTLYNSVVNFNYQHLKNNVYMYILANFSIKKSFESNNYLELTYNKHIEFPSLVMLFPMENLASPLNIQKGNSDLQPEKKHGLELRYILFDAFSMTNLLTSLRFNVREKPLSTKLTELPNLVQSFETINADKLATNLSLFVQCGTKIPSLKMSFTVGTNQSKSQSPYIISEKYNIHSLYEHVYTIQLRNTNDKIIEFNSGVTVNFSNVKYSINKELNNVYSNYKFNTAISIRPFSKMYFQFNYDMNYYTAKFFDKPMFIPIFSSELGYYFLNNNRVIVSIKGFDILNQNKNIMRTSQGNLIVERKTNTINQYFLLTLKYYLNKAGSKASIPEA